MRQTLAFLTGLGGGYLGAKEQEYEKARQAKADQRAQETHESAMYEQRRRQLADAVLAQAGRPMIAASNGMSRPDYADDRDIGSDPTATLQPTATANTPDGQRSRVAAALYGMGDVERADKLVQAGKSAELTDLQLQNTKDTLSREKAFRDASSRFYRVGWQGLPDLYKDYNDGNTLNVKEDGRGGATVSFFGPDGKLVRQEAYPHKHAFVTEAMINLDPRLYVEHAERQVKEAREGAESGSKIDFNRAHANQANASAEALRTKADATIERMSEADKATLDSINKQREILTNNMGRAQATGDWDEKTPGAQALRKALNTLAVQQRAVLDKYNSGSTADPAQVFKGRNPGGAGVGPSPGAKVDPKEQAARDADSMVLLQSELATAQRRLDAGDATQQEIIDGLKREIARAPKPTAAFPAPGPRATVAAAAGMPAPAPAAPAQPDPGQRLDAARAAVRQLQTAPPGLAKGRAAIDAYAAQMEAARAELRAAVDAYTRSLNPDATRAAFGRPPVAARAGM